MQAMTVTCERKRQIGMSSVYYDAAQRIVRLAAPFPALPPDKTRVDELYITRTWQFLPGNVLRNY